MTRRVNGFAGFTIHSASAARRAPSGAAGSTISGDNPATAESAPGVTGSPGDSVSPRRSTLISCGAAEVTA